MICADPQLSTRDEQLADTYKNALAATRRTDKLRKSQRDWLVTTRNLCRDVECVKQVYLEREQQLQVLLAEENSKYVEIAEKDVQSCRTVVNLINSHKLEASYVSYETSEKDKLKIKKSMLEIIEKELIKFEEGTSLAGGEYYYHDFDDDGVLDVLVISMPEGQIGLVDVYFLSGRINSEADVLAGRESIGTTALTDYKVVNIDGRYYIYGSDINGPIALWRASRGQLSSVCKFSIEKIDVKLTRSQHPVCQKAFSGVVSYVNYSIPYKLVGSVPDIPGYTSSLGEKAALIDINNDDKPEYLVEAFALTNSGKQYCGGLPYLSVLDEKKSIVPNNSINKLLSEELLALGFSEYSYHPVCVNSVNVFVYENNRYIDVRANDDNRAIYMLKSGHFEKMCERLGLAVYKAD
jgi:hypothetical protein